MKKCIFNSDCWQKSLCINEKTFGEDIKIAWDAKLLFKDWMKMNDEISKLCYAVSQDMT